MQQLSDAGRTIAVDRLRLPIATVENLMDRHGLDDKYSGAMWRNSSHSEYMSLLRASETHASLLPVVSNLVQQMQLSKYTSEEDCQRCCRLLATIALSPHSTPHMASEAINAIAVQCARNVSDMYASLKPELARHCRELSALADGASWPACSTVVAAVTALLRNAHATEDHVIQVLYGSIEDGDTRVDLEDSLEEAQINALIDPEAGRLKVATLVNTALSWVDDIDTVSMAISVRGLYAPRGDTCIRSNIAISSFPTSQLFADIAARSPNLLGTRLCTALLKLWDAVPERSQLVGIIVAALVS